MLQRERAKRTVWRKTIPIVNDLANNEEVKEAARMFNQIDLVLKGEIVIVGRRQWLKIDEKRFRLAICESSER